MNNYVFIISERGAKINSLSDFEIITLKQLIKYLKEDIEIKKYNEGKTLNERKREHILNYGKKIRIAKINDFGNFRTRLLKFITLKEFEEIFEKHNKDIIPLLEYDTYESEYFGAEILKKYGVKKENKINEN